MNKFDKVKGEISLFQISVLILSANGLDISACARVCISVVNLSIAKANFHGMVTSVQFQSSLSLHEGDYPVGKSVRLESCDKAAETIHFIYLLIEF